MAATPKPLRKALKKAIKSQTEHISRLKPRHKLSETQHTKKIKKQVKSTKKQISSALDKKSPHKAKLKKERESYFGYGTE